MDTRENYRMCDVPESNFCRIPYGHVMHFAGVECCLDPENLDDVPFYCDVPNGHVANQRVIKP